MNNFLFIHLNAYISIIVHGSQSVSHSSQRTQGYCLFSLEIALNQSLNITQCLLLNKWATTHLLVVNCYRLL